MRAMSSAQMPAGSDAVRRARVDQRVPHGDRALGVDPDLVAEVAGVAGARDRDGDVAHRGVHEPEVLERARGRRARAARGSRARAGPAARARRLSPRRPRRRRPARRAFMPQPAQVRLGAREAVRAVVEAADRAVVDAPCRAASHHGVYSTWPTAHLVTSRVTMRSSSRAASRPVIRYL